MTDQLVPCTACAARGVIVDPETRETTNCPECGGNGFRADPRATPPPLPPPDLPRAPR